MDDNKQSNLLFTCMCIAYIVDQLNLSNSVYTEHIYCHIEIICVLNSFDILDFKVLVFHIVKNEEQMFHAGKKMETLNVQYQHFLKFVKGMEQVT